MIGTGQTGLIQGARYGVALDAVPSQFCAGELEATVVKAFEIENPDEKYHIFSFNLIKRFFLAVIYDNDTSVTMV